VATFPGIPQLSFATMSPESSMSFAHLNKNESVKTIFHNDTNYHAPGRKVILVVIGAFQLSRFAKDSAAHPKESPSREEQNLNVAPPTSTVASGRTISIKLPHPENAHLSRLSKPLPIATTFIGVQPQNA
jgi:hypothetical protein